MSLQETDSWPQADRWSAGPGSLPPNPATRGSGLAGALNWVTETGPFPGHCSLSTERRQSWALHPAVPLERPLPSHTSVLEWRRPGWARALLVEEWAQRVPLGQSFPESPSLELTGP